MISTVAEPSKVENEHLDTVRKALRQGRLSTIHCVMLQILSVMEDPRASVADLANIYGVDAPSSARLLRMSNSILHSTLNGGQVDSLETAIIRLGFNRALEVLMSATICDLFEGGRGGGDFTLAGLWQNSVAVAACNRLIYTCEFSNPSGEAYLSGLLHNLGVVLICQFLFHQGGRATVVRREENDSMLIDEERQCLGLTHEDLGGLIAEQWGFNDTLGAAMRYHHSVRHAPYHQQRLLHVLRTSQMICYEDGYGYSDFNQDYLRQCRRSRRELGISDASVESLRRRLADEIELKRRGGFFL